MPSSRVASGEVGILPESRVVFPFMRRMETRRDRKNLRNSEYSGFRLFGRIEWVPPLKTKKLLKVIRRTGK